MRMSRVTKLVAATVGVVLILVAVGLWWNTRPPKRPRGVSPGAIYVEGGSVPFTLLRNGVWVECWFNGKDNDDHCRMTDIKGNVELDGVFVPYKDSSPVPESELRFDKTRTGGTWLLTPNGIEYPAVYLKNGQILIPQSDAENARRALERWGS
jgi:hypothetical protein